VHEPSRLSKPGACKIPLGCEVAVRSQAATSRSRRSRGEAFCGRLSSIKRAKWTGHAARSTKLQARFKLVAASGVGEAPQARPRVFASSDEGRPPAAAAANRAPGDGARLQDAGLRSANQNIRVADGARENVCAAVIAGVDAAPVLEFREPALVEVAQLVDFGVVGDRGLVVLLPRYAARDFQTEQGLTGAIAPQRSC
jgi:hypothetical protein